MTVTRVRVEKVDPAVPYGHNWIVKAPDVKDGFYFRTWQQAFEYAYRMTH